MTLREFLAVYKDSFGGGMIPFDTVYHAALRNGATPAEAQRQGGHALLDGFVAQFEDDGRHEWADAYGMPVEP